MNWWRLDSIATRAEAIAAAQFSYGPDSRPYLAGVTSRATDAGGRCGPGGIYVIPAAPPVRAWLEARGVSFP
jgi:hypothetical protein